MAASAHAPRIVRSVVVGALATTSDLTSLALLVSGIGLDPRLASPLSLLIGAAVQLVGTKLYVFQDRSPRWLAQGLAFAAVEVMAFALNLVLFHVGATLRLLPPLPLRLAISALVYASISFPVWARVFAPAAFESPCSPQETLS